MTTRKSVGSNSFTVDDANFDNGDRLQSRKFTDGTNQARIDITYTGDSQVSTLSRYSDTAGTTLVGSTADSYDALKCWVEK